MYEYLHNYADDINLIVTNECFSVIPDILSLYERSIVRSVYQLKRSVYDVIGIIRHPRIRHPRCLYEIETHR